MVMKAVISIALYFTDHDEHPALYISIYIYIHIRSFMHELTWFDASGTEHCGEPVHSMNKPGEVSIYIICYRQNVEQQSEHVLVL